jgi:outer membrane protein with beta-barrel domain
MSLKTRVVTVVFAVSVPCLPTLAQSPPTSSSGKHVTPPPGTWAAGADLGFVNPIGDEDVDLEPFADGYIEHFFTSNVSLRGMLSLYSFNGPDLPPPSSDGVDILAINADVLYQWEGGSVHPFVTGGLGFYDYSSDFEDDGLELGLKVGGGANFYLTKAFAIKVEGDFHETTAERVDSFFTGTAGARWLW